MKQKVTVVGAGNVGASLVERLHTTGLVDVVLVDIPETGGMPKGKCLDIEQGGSVLRSDSSVIGAADYEQTKNSDIVVLTAGFPRKPGMTREQLLDINAKIVSSVARQIISASPKAILIVVTNPLDAMCFVALRETKWPRNRVIGMAGILDASRLERLIAQKLGVSIENVSACVLGTHGETMVPVPSATTVFGVPITKLMKESEIAEVVQKCVQGGAEIVGLLKTSAYYTPAACVMEMIMAIIKDKRKILPCSVYLEGEFGLKDVYLGVPAVLGKNGVERVMEVPLNDQEKAAMDKAAKAVQEMQDYLKKSPVPA
ncbi:MAG: malate dehydrogenase [Elusimicrobia bacterium]|nr:malate dehydrogenase [Elusimicrobiota bacterium]